MTITIIIANLASSPYCTMLTECNSTEDNKFNKSDNKAVCLVFVQMKLLYTNYGSTQVFLTNDQWLATVIAFPTMTNEFGEVITAIQHSSTTGQYPSPIQHPSSTAITTLSHHINSLTLEQPIAGTIAAKDMPLPIELCTHDNFQWASDGYVDALTTFDDAKSLAAVFTAGIRIQGFIFSHAWYDNMMVLLCCCDDVFARQGCVRYVEGVLLNTVHNTVAQNTTTCTVPVGTLAYANDPCCNSTYTHFITHTFIMCSFVVRLNVIIHTPHCKRHFTSFISALQFTKSL